MLACLALLGAGCEGRIGALGATDPTTPSDAGPAIPPAVDGGEMPSEGTGESLRRLTMAQYTNTLHDLIAWSLNDASAADTVMSSELHGALGALPSDQREPVPQDVHGSFRRLDQSVQQTHVEAFYAVGAAAGQALTRTSQRLGAVAGTCATDSDGSNDAACLDAFVRRFGAHALRRPLDEDEVRFYREVYGTDTTASAAGYADVIAVMLNAPQCLYFVEHGETAVDETAGVYDVSAYELASRLSYQFTDTLPDEALFAAAADGSLSRPDVFARQLARLLADPRARTSLVNFYVDWLKLTDLPALDQANSDHVFMAFAGGDLPDGQLRQAMIDDVVAMVDYYTWSQPGGIADLFGSERSFARSTALARIYGVAPWDGMAMPPALPPGQRPGLLTRALFLASGSANTRPILKGVFIRRGVLCDDIAPPPPGANAVPPALSPDLTTRQVVEHLTQSPGTVCAACHTTVINPLGFATEGFDSLGRFRTHQQLFAADGTPTTDPAVDTTSVPQVVGGDTTPSTGAGDLSRLVVASGKVESCLARNYFRYTFARWDDATADRATLDTLQHALSGGAHLNALFGAIATTPAFRQRRYH